MGGARGAVRGGISWMVVGERWRSAAKYVIIGARVTREGTTTICFYHIVEMAILS